MTIELDNGVKILFKNNSISVATKKYSKPMRYSTMLYLMGYLDMRVRTSRSKMLEDNENYNNKNKNR